MGPAEMWQLAERYRRMALVIDDPLAHQALLDLASEYEAQAQAVERRRKSDRHHNREAG
jgi:hypothetical protein